MCRLCDELDRRLKGGQGRTPRDLKRDAAAFGLCLVALAAVIICAIVCALWR